MAGRTLLSVGSPCLPTLNELIRPVTMVSLVNAVLFATRFTMSSEATAYPIRRYVRQPAQISRPQVSTNLNLDESGRESAVHMMFSNQPYKKQQ